MRARVYWYIASHGVHARHPQSTRVFVQILSGGGGGMGSRTNMDFPIVTEAYPLYGKKGGPSCWDTTPAHSCVATDGETFGWSNHNLLADQPVFVTGNQGQLWYVHGPSLTGHTFKLSQYPYTAPGVTTPYVPHNWGGTVSLEINPYRYAALGGNGGGIIGDQAIPGITVGFYNEAPYSSSIYFPGDCGENALGAGGCGGDSIWNGGGAAQIGGSPGNAGLYLKGGGGSGAGFLNPDGSYPTHQFGPGGGAGGTLGEIECDLKPSYFFNAGAGGAPGAAGVGGFAGGEGGHGVVIVREYFS